MMLALGSAFATADPLLGSRGGGDAQAAVEEIQYHGFASDASEAILNALLSYIFFYV